MNRGTHKEFSNMSSPTVTKTVIGVGFDTARYGHYATFLREDLQPAAKPVEFLETRSGYRALEQRFAKLAHQHPGVHFQIRVDAAGQYATNLLAFLHHFPWPKTISVGDPLRNKRYREVHFPKRKTDAAESYACARFALVEAPNSTPPVSPELATLQEVTSRLEFQVKQSTREVNRLHNLLGRVFPELAILQNDISAGWVLKLLDKYPTAERIARAKPQSLLAIAYLPKKKAGEIHRVAGQSVAAERGTVVEELVRQSVRGLRQSLDSERKLKQLLEKAFDALPDQRVRQIASIKGIGKQTAAVLVAKIVSIDRFPSADHLTSYFGVFPEEDTSGVDKRGKPIPPGTMRMSRKGNDLVRKHLWMAAMVAKGSNPQVRALYARLQARGRRGDVALGHCMRKLLHQVFAIWTSGKAYDPQYRKQTDASANEPIDSSELGPEENKVAGRKQGNRPEGKAVTATTSTVSSTTVTVNSPKESVLEVTDGVAEATGSVDFAYVRSQITMERVLRHLGYFDRLRGRGLQRRGPCPIHGTKRARGRTFSVHLGKDVFQCFHPPCGAAGNVLDLWSAIHRLTPYEAARHLAQTFDLQLTRNTEKRNP
jgi:transposase